MRFGWVAVLAALAMVVAACATAVPGTAVPAPARIAPLPGVVSPTEPGWSPVRSVELAVVYDVPPDWDIQPKGSIMEYSDPTTRAPRVVGSASTKYGRGQCGGDWMVALSVLRHDSGTDLAAAALTSARGWADAGYRDDDDTAPTLVTRPPENLTTAAGQQAVMVRVDATIARLTGAGCGATGGATYAIAVSSSTGELGPTTVLVVVADTGSPKAVSDELIRRILRTLRPLSP